MCNKRIISLVLPLGLLAACTSLPQPASDTVAIAATGAVRHYYLDQPGFTCRSPANPSQVFASWADHVERTPEGLIRAGHRCSDVRYPLAPESVAGDVSGAPPTLQINGKVYRLGEEPEKEARKLPAVSNDGSAGGRQ